MTCLAVKKLNQLNVSPAARIVKAGDYQLMVQAAQMIADIEQQARMLYRKEKENAQQAAEAQVRQERSAQMLDTVAASIEYLSRLEGQLTKIVIKAVEKIIGDLEDTEATSKMVEKALYQVRNESRVTLRVSPDSMPPISQQARELVAAYPNIDFVDVVADPGIAGGACRLETPLGSIDTGIAAQIEALKEALEKSFTSQSE